MIDWSYDAWPAIEPAWHEGATVEPGEFHVDLGCGTLKKGRIGVDRYPAPGVNVVMDMDSGAVYGMSSADAQCAVPHSPWTRGRDKHGFNIRILGHGLPFPDNSIESVISHHALEHIGEGFLPLVDDVYRVLKPDGIFVAITPLFPSAAAVSDADHCRYFMEDTWEAFCGTPGDTPQHCWLSSFSVPYTRARFNMERKDCSPRCEPEKHWTGEDAREIRVTLRAMK